MNFSFRRDPGSNPACRRKLFFSWILRSFYIPMKSMSIMILTSIFLKKCIDRKKSNLQQVWTHVLTHTSLALIHYATWSLAYQIAIFSFLQDWQWVLGFCLIPSLTMHYSVLEGPGSNPACGRYFVAQILRNSYVPVKRINIMMLTCIFLEKYSNKKSNKQQD